MPKPLAIDLSKAKLFDAANAAIKKFVAGWTQNPNHMPLCVCHDAPCAVSFKFRSMGDFKDACFSTSLALLRKVWVSPTEPVENFILYLAASIIDFLHMRFAVVEEPPAATLRNVRLFEPPASASPRYARLRTITLIGPDCLEFFTAVFAK